MSKGMFVPTIKGVPQLLQALCYFFKT